MTRTRKTFKPWPLMAAIAAAGLIAPAWALDLQQAWDAAKAFDANVKAAQAAAQGGRARVDMAEANRRLNISAAASASAVNTSNAGNYGSYTAALRARLPLYRPALELGVRQAEQASQEANASLDQETRALAVRLSGAYFNALLTMEQQKLNQSQQAFVSTQLEAAVKSLSSGTGTRPDVDEAQARLDQLLVEALQIRQNRDLALRVLRSLTNESGIQLRDINPAALPQQGPAASDLDRYLGAAERNSAEVRAARARVEQARWGLAITDKANSPTVDATGQVSRSGSDTVSTANTAYSLGAVGIEVNIPIFNGGYDAAAKVQAASAQSQTEAALDSVRRDVALKTQKEFQTVVESLARIKALQQASESAERLVGSTRRAFDAGVRTRLDILNANDKLQTLQRDLSAARIEYLTAVVRLEAAAGENIDATLKTLNGMLSR